MRTVEDVAKLAEILAKADGEQSLEFVASFDEIILRANLKGLSLSDFRELRKLDWHLTSEYGSHCLRMWAY